ncbi:ribonuclease E inhibitor RraB [Rhodococcus sp. NPDC058521]|uniref:ribonuclease E inhibitor RraB n=1 Tax=Rhodococcus sp. NPDC058521 TaxID=3346536 RepID=UPI0036465DDC
MGSLNERKGWFRRLFGRSTASPLDPTRDDLVVVVSGFDDAEACSTALDRAAATDPQWVPEAEAVLRHHLRLPAEGRGEAVRIAAQDGYEAVDSDSASGGGEAVRVVLQRVQVLDPLHCSQERSRMAGLAQRLDGTVDGWDAMQPAARDGVAPGP